MPERAIDSVGETTPVRKQAHWMRWVLVPVLASSTAIAINVATNQIPRSIHPYLWLSWPLLVILTGVDIAVHIFQSRSGERGESQGRKPVIIASAPDGLEPTDDRQANAGTAVAPRIDLSAAPEVRNFYGRKAQLATVARWMEREETRLVAIIGIGGVGKTSLAAEAARTSARKFQHILWRSFVNRPPLDEFLTDTIEFLSDERISSATSADRKLSRLISILTEHRCLMVLDNIDSLFGANDDEPFAPGYEGYGQLFTVLGGSSHRSCVLMTSRERLPEVALLDGYPNQVKTFTLHGIDRAAARRVLDDKGLRTTTPDLASLVERTSGNPLVLKWTAELVRESFSGDVGSFLRHSTLVLGQPRLVLAGQLDRISDAERHVMYWLAIEREPVTLDVLLSQTWPAPTREQLTEAIYHLQRRSLIEVSSHGFLLQNVVLEYVTQVIVDRTTDELTAGQQDLISSVALMNPDSKDYVRSAQERVFVRPIAARLKDRMSLGGVTVSLRQFIATARENSAAAPAYTIGNILNLMHSLGIPLSGLDLSGLCVWSADLRDCELHDVEFRGSDLSRSAFADSFDIVLSAVFSPHGEYIAIGTGAGEVRTVDLRSGAALRVLEGHSNWVRDVCINPSGALIASASYDHTVRLWDAEDGRCADVLEGHADKVYAVAFCHEGEWLASASDDGSTRIWSTVSGECLQVMEAGQGGLRALAVSPDDSLIATGSSEGIVSIWDTSTANRIRHVTEDSGTVFSLAFSADGRYLAAGTHGGIAVIWNVLTGEETARLNIGSRVYSIAFTPDGERIVFGCYDNTVRLWNTFSWSEERVLQGHTSWIWCVAFSPDGTTLISGSHDQSARIWETASGRCVRTLVGYSSGVYSIAFSRDARTFAAGCEREAINMWRTDDWSLERSVHAHQNRVGSIAVSADGEKMVSGSTDRSVRLWQVPAGQLIFDMRGHADSIWAVALSPDGKFIASGGNDHAIFIWTAATGRSVRKIQVDSGVWSLAFSPDGSMLASGAKDGTMMLWDPHSGDPLHEPIRHPRCVRGLAFNDHRPQLASGSEDGVVRLWSYDGQSLTAEFAADFGAVYSVAFSPGGEWLAAGYHDRTVCVWELETGRPLKVLEGHSAAIWSVAFQPDGNALASGSDDGTIRIWSMPGGECIRVVRQDRPYERMNIADATGLNSAQVAALLSLGAIY